MPPSHPSQSNLLVCCKIIVIVLQVSFVAASRSHTIYIQCCECKILAKQPRYMLKTNFLVAEKIIKLRTLYLSSSQLLLVCVITGCTCACFFFSSVLYTNFGQPNWAGGVQPNCLSRSLQIAGGQNSDYCS